MLDFFNIQDFPGLLDLHIYCANIYKDLPFTFFLFCSFPFFIFLETLQYDPTVKKFVT